MGNSRIEDLLGDSSSYTAMTDKEKDYFVKLLQEEMQRREDSGRVEQVRDIVRIEDWINSDYYVGSDQKSIYPYWKDFIVDIFRDTRKDDEKINSVILSGCFTGDTKVSLLDGRELSFLELLDEYGYDGKFWVYSCTSDGDVVPGLAHSVHKTNVSTRIAIVKLDNGEEIKCTPDHRFMLRDGSYVEAKDLVSGSSLMPLYRDYVKKFKGDTTPLGYERCYNPLDDSWFVSHKKFSEMYHSDEIKAIKDRYINQDRCAVVTHHVNFNKLDNRPDNLRPMELHEHIKYHTKHMKDYYSSPSGVKHRAYLSSVCKNNIDRLHEGHRKFLDSIEGKKICAKNLEKWNNRDGFSESDVNRWKEAVSRGSLKWWSSEDGLKEKEKRSSIFKYRNSSGYTGERLREFYKTDRGLEIKRDKAKLFHDMNKRKAKEIIDSKRLYYDSLGITYDIIVDIASSVSSWGKFIRKINSLYNTGIKSTSNLTTFLKCYGILNKKDFTINVCKNDSYVYKNHTVVSVEIIDSCVDVYDLEVDEYHNFALSSGVFVHNSIGIGKSTVAELIMMRKMYELSCFRNINAMFNLMSKTNIMFLYFSVNQKQAERTGFGEYRALIDNSPYFNENFQRNPRLNSLLVFPEGISYAYGSSANDSIGMSVICSMLDEANFLGGGGPSKDSEKATDLYANIVNRSNSRFIIDGGVNHSLNILVSSATYENSATERQIRLSRNDPHTIVAAPAQWDVKPKNFSKKFFYVFKGSNYLEANIVNSTDDVNNYRVSEGMSKHKYIDGLEDYDSINKAIEELPPHMQTKFLKVPVDLRNGFEANLLRSLQDIGGVSTGSQGKLFSSPMVLQDCIDVNRHHPFVSKEIVISTGDDINVKDYLRDDFRLKYPERPRYLHIDQSFRTDSTGISCVYVDDIVEEDGVKKPVFGVDFMLRINPPKPPKKIAIYKIRNFVIYLVNVIGMKIGKLTYDIFNSEESRQILEEMGFNVGYLSVDRTDKPYLDLVEIMYEKRIKLYDYPILRYELLNLLHDRIRRKVDHPKVVTDDGFVDYDGKGNDGVTGTRVGSKDVSDSLCGAIQNALQSTVSDAEGNNGTFSDFLMANRIGSYAGIDAPTDISVEEMIDRQIDDMIEEMEINGFY